MKLKRKMLSLALSLVVCLSMGVTAYASEGIESSTSSFQTSEFYAIEKEASNVPTPRYTANVEYSNIPASHATHGGNKFNLGDGTEITVNFKSTGKFSIALYNHDTGKYWISDAVHESSCSSIITVRPAGNYSMGAYNRDTKTIDITGSYSL